MKPGLTFKALGNETRRRILHLLRQGDRTAGEIADAFTTTKPTISHHLATLREAGLIVDERRGQNISYSLNTSVVEEILRWLADLTDQDDGADIRPQDADHSPQGADHSPQDDDHPHQTATDSDPLDADAPGRSQ